MELVAVGKVRDSHGLKGEIFIMPFSGESPWISQLKEFWLEFKAPDEEGKHVVQKKKFTVKSARPHKKGIIFKTAELNDRTEADGVIGGQFLVPQELTVSKKGEKIFLSEIEGFQVEDVKLGPIGKIIKFSTNGPQDLLIVSKDEKEYQVPLINEFIEKIMWDQKIIKMKLPDGLLNEES